MMKIFALLVTCVCAVERANDMYLEPRSDTANLPATYAGPRKVNGLFSHPVKALVRKATTSFLRKTSDNKWDVGIPLSIWHKYAKKNNIPDGDDQASPLPAAAGYVKMQPEDVAGIPGTMDTPRHVIAVTTAAAETVSTTPKKKDPTADSPMKSYTTPEIMIQLADQPESNIKYHRKTFDTEAEARAYIKGIMGGDKEFSEIPKANQVEEKESADEENDVQQDVEEDKKGGAEVEQAEAASKEAAMAKDGDAKQIKEMLGDGDAKQIKAAESEMPKERTMTSY